MPALNRKLKIILSTGCEGVLANLSRLLPSLRVSADFIQLAPDEILAALAEQPVDALIMDADDFDIAAEISEHSFAAVLILANAERFSNLQMACIASGIILSVYNQLEFGFAQMLAMASRLRSMRVQTNTLQRKLNDTRLVNRAKLLLMSHLKMSEAEAHRYIEKSAMDASSKRRDVAVRIIKTYEE